MGNLANVATVVAATPLVDLQAHSRTGAVGTRDDGYRRELELAFAVGAGRLDRSYAVGRAGRLWFAPLEVLSAADDLPRRAALAPGHAVQSDLRFDSPIAEECLACHTDQLPPRSYPLNLAPEGDHWTPRGISCAQAIRPPRPERRWISPDPGLQRRLRRLRRMVHRLNNITAAITTAPPRNGQSLPM